MNLVVMVFHVTNMCMGVASEMINRHVGVATHMTCVWEVAYHMTYMCLGLASEMINRHVGVAYHMAGVWEWPFTCQSGVWEWPTS